MILETHEVLDRYNISRSTLANYMPVINDKQGVEHGSGGSSRNLYKSSVLDSLARQGKLGTQPLKAILILDERKNTKEAS